MSRPIQLRSINGATSAVAGDDLVTGGRATLGLFVTATADPAGSLAVEIQGSMDGDNWSPMYDAGGSKVGVLDGSDFSDPDSNGTYSGLVSFHGASVRYVRAAITTYAGGNVTAWVSATSNESQHDYREITG